MNRHMKMDLVAGQKLTIDQLDLLRRERLALSKLTPKQKKFCEVYVRTFNKETAMAEAGYYMPKQKGTSQQRLVEKNYREIMSSEAVQTYIALLKESVASRLGMSMDDIVDEYKAMAFANMDDYVAWNENGVTVVDSETLTRAQKAGVVEITETTTKQGKTVRVKLYSKQPALDRLYEILKELEGMEVRKDGGNKISQTQINLILQDPVLRRSIERLAECITDRPILLSGQDKDRMEFEQFIEKTTKSLLGGMIDGGGRRRKGPSGTPGVPEGCESESESPDAGNNGNGDPVAAAQGERCEQEVGENQQGEPSEAEGEGEGSGGSDNEAADRYDIDGL